MKEKNLNFTLTNIRKVLRENCYSPKFNNDDFKNEKGVYFHYREWRPTKTCRKLWMNKEWFDQHTKELLDIIESRFKNL